MEPIRIQKYLSDCQIMSRRSAERAIEAGNIKINGVLAKLGDKIDPSKDTLVFNGKVIKPQDNSKKRYIMLNKPLGYVCTLNDEKGRKTVLDLLDINERVYPVGRLDMYSEGLLLLTNDGELTNKLTHPSGEFKKTYSVLIKGELSGEKINELTSPMEIDGYTIKPVKVRIISVRDGVTNCLFILSEGRNRQIRKMCEKCSLTVMKLTRISVGKLKLGDLKKGEYRDLTKEEVDYLYGRNS